jgi:hypothetical protein
MNGPKASDRCLQDVGRFERRPLKIRDLQAAAATNRFEITREKEVDLMRTKLKAIVGQVGEIERGAGQHCGNSPARFR